MGFCYLNQIAVTALQLRQKGLSRVAVWDFDAHHGNGTEAILAGKRAFGSSPSTNHRVILEPARTT